MTLGLIKDTKLKEETPLVDVNFTHSLCIGQTGSGKTTSFIYPNIKNRMELGHGILFFDIKGSEHLALKKLASDADRLDDVIEIGKPWGSNINIIESLNNRTFATLLMEIVGEPANGGSNTFFYNEAISLGSSIFNTLKLKSIISKELHELDKDTSFVLEKYFTLGDLYSIIYNIDTLYEFIQDGKKFLKSLHSFIIRNTEYYHGEKSEVYKNIVLNYSNMKVGMKYFTKYDVEADSRSSGEKFEASLLSVISTLSSGFSFMSTSSAKYISEKENPLGIVESLQDGKIIIINVRVIPDTILELMLDQIFEKMIDLNLQSEKDKKPISIFIDEAQRLINKDIPLDVLRSSKVDVLMAVQSEIQLISKFKSREDWQQISVNIAQKYAFRSSFFGGDHLLSFYVDTATLNIFEYAKEHDANKLRAKPIFLNKEDFDNVEHSYQHKVLKLKNIEKNEILFYDVTHFENEREVILINTNTKQKKYRKLFTDFQDKLIENEIKFYLKEPIESLVTMHPVPQDKLQIMYDKYKKYNKTRLEQTFVSRFSTQDKAFSCTYDIGELLAKNDEDTDILDIYDSLIRDEFSEELTIDEYSEDDKIITNECEELATTLVALLEENGVFVINNKDFFSVYFMREIPDVTPVQLRLQFDDLNV
ncbi:type IV secretory system conjugative DNA transfer family protein [Candidatus Sulfurimonas baltica]|uniref:Type IV secretion system coupling protein TraD DNA-binding domain-containing protein n=1 Tax=Candidatus Sulfurimonas baltica TaxID=2740404 RepID=A0A7S7LTA5_9BACT|nr:type IV secretory system conjugative DNA transfer family protein [Candidatus Sulfurimonas baltica]QOY50948.1 hypothetical protein HUE88_07265 [Candidatus Sulfurimonas baltica]